ncbi:hypothetical protein BT69DRAFT_1351945 [Atractiella rhizophila]|nr:hypothetical protein BT69DRAFT_1351945 [Atractiella rhizophila]
MPPAKAKPNKQSSKPPLSQRPASAAKLAKKTANPRAFKPLTALFGDASSQTSETAEIKYTKKSKKRKVEEIEEEDISWDSDVQAVVVTPTDGKGKAKGKAVLQREGDPEGNNGQMWIDCFPPTCLEELAVQPKKIEQVKAWLNRALDPSYSSTKRKYHRLLVLSGPSGSCKTATVRCVAEELGANVLEYRNLHNLEYANEHRDKLAGDFESWLHRSSSTNVLSFSDSAGATSTSVSNPTSTLLLVEDLPPLFTYAQLSSFRAALKSHVLSPHPSAPVVLIVSNSTVKSDESRFTGSGGLMDGTLNAWRVAGEEILGSVGTAEIKFNPVAKTVMKKALSRLVESGRFRELVGKWKPEAKALETVLMGSNGDMRAALNMLQFFVWGGECEGGMDKKDRRKLKNKDELLKLPNTGADDSLFLFHALGKVLYNKRWDQREEDDKKDLKRGSIKQRSTTDKLPKHLRKEWKRMPSKVDPERLVEEGSIDPEVFLTYIHENYPPFTNEIDECANILEYLSLCTLPLPSAYSYSVSVRSLLLCLPSPPPYNGQTFHKASYWDRARELSENALRVEEMGRRGGDGFLECWWRERKETKVEWIGYLGAMGRGGKEVKKISNFRVTLQRGQRMEEEDVGFVEGGGDEDFEMEFDEGEEEEEWFVKEDDIVD